MPRFKLLIQRYPYGGVEASECVSWLMQTYLKASRDQRFYEVRSSWINDTPITMTRNQSLVAARKAGFDFMLMVDSDMAPDCELLGGDPAAVPFYDTAIEHALKSPTPCIIAAPYCGPPPHENVYVFRWANRGNTLAPSAANARLDQFTREEASQLAGIQEVGALPTGLMLIDLRALDKLPHPYTYYEYDGAGGAGSECPACHQKPRGPETKKASTEDVTFTRDLGLLGVPILCAWSSWAGHIKRYIVGKPRAYTADFVSHKMRDAIVGRRFAGEELVQVEADPELMRLAAERHNNGFRQPDQPSMFADAGEVVYGPEGPVASQSGRVVIDEAAFLRPERGVVPTAGEHGRVWTPELDAALKVAVEASAGPAAGHVEPDGRDHTAAVLAELEGAFPKATTADANPSRSGWEEFTGYDPNAGSAGPQPVQPAPGTSFDNPLPVPPSVNAAPGVFFRMPGYGGIAITATTAPGSAPGGTIGVDPGFAGLMGGSNNGLSANPGLEPHYQPSPTQNIDPGFAALVNQTFTPAPGLRDNFAGPTAGVVDGAAPPPEGIVYPWQLSSADLAEFNDPPAG